jgi:nitroreductase
MFKDLVIKNRSYRGFDFSRKIEREELIDMIECARLTPCGANKQPLKYFIAYNEKTVEEIQSITKWAAGLPQMELPRKGEEPVAYIVICQDLNIDKLLKQSQTVIGIAAQTILLSATDKGLGGCMIGNFNRIKLKKMLSLDENIEPVLLIALGKPIEIVELTDLKQGESTNYFRDDNNKHYVPKRTLNEILINQK